ncbi:unnamed protein product, partial [Ectocarpus sp. 12 AP-2014]
LVYTLGYPGNGRARYVCCISNRCARTAAACPRESSPRQLGALRNRPDSGALNPSRGKFRRLSRSMCSPWARAARMPSTRRVREFRQCSGVLTPRVRKPCA